MPGVIGGFEDDDLDVFTRGNKIEIVQDLLFGFQVGQFHKKPFFKPENYYLVHSLS